MGSHACDKCGKSFGSEEALEQHDADYDHSKLERCSDCGETFTAEAALQDHRKTHRNSVMNAVLSVNRTYAGIGLVALVGFGALLLFGGGNGNPPTGAAAGGGLGFSSDDPTLGDPNASVTIYYFGDYGCPSCRAFEQRTFPQLRTGVIEAGDARFVKKNFPVVTHQSPLLAQASQAVWEQVRQDDPDIFWNWHKRIYDKQGREGSGWATQQNIISITGQVDGVDADAVRTALNRNTYRNEVQQDLTEGRQQGVRGTPTFIIHGAETGRSVRLVGPQPVARFQNAMRQVR